MFEVTDISQITLDVFVDVGELILLVKLTHLNQILEYRHYIICGIMSDVWDDDTSDIYSNDTLKSLRKIEMEGYIESKPHEDSLNSQRGFDRGFTRGLQLGRVCGELYALILKEKSELQAIGSIEYNMKMKNFNRLEDFLLHEIPTLSDRSKLSEYQLLLNEFSPKAIDLFNSIISIVQS